MILPEEMIFYKTYKFLLRTIILATTGKRTGVEGKGLIKIQPTVHKSALLFCFSVGIQAQEIILRALHRPTLKLPILNTCKF